MLPAPDPATDHAAQDRGEQSEELLADVSIAINLTISTSGLLANYFIRKVNHAILSMLIRAREQSNGWFFVTGGDMKVLYALAFAIALPYASTANAQGVCDESEALAAEAQTNAAEAAYDNYF